MQASLFQKDLSKSISISYILVGKGAQLRVRIYGVDSDKTFKKCFICLKTTDKLIRDEYEYLIPEQDGKELYKKCKWFLEKKRLTFDSHSKPKVRYDVDSFPNGMQWVEVEFKSIKDMKKWEKNIPSWIGKEITGVNKYSNITLAKKKLKFNNNGKR
jgi:CYTH domain-containing protein